MTPDLPRVIAVFDEYDSRNFRTARAYLEFRLKNTKDAKVTAVREAALQGIRGVQAHYRVKSVAVEETFECLIVLRHGLVYQLLLRTTGEHYNEDSRLFAQVRAGFRWLPIPKGGCTNP